MCVIPQLNHTRIASVVRFLHWYLQLCTSIMLRTQIFLIPTWKSVSVCQPPYTQHSARTQHQVILQLTVSDIGLIGALAVALSNTHSQSSQTHRDSLVDRSTHWLVLVGSTYPSSVVYTYLSARRLRMYAQRVVSQYSSVSTNVVGQCRRDRHFPIGS